ncbi:hypothetical protein CAMRE0001_1786 [Campylobacter rectus RM3267]|uniref:Uncharacterized protein n=1 Tax=Campylobacter rectus RM3267 TaxID=553218 RepID=B9CYG6_CAMRE|nr:hypothetical protein CAMRE0001_1786 [Campylobacter rectus RM3267]
MPQSSNYLPCAVIKADYLRQILTVWVKFQNLTNSAAIFFAT